MKVDEWAAGRSLTPPRALTRIVGATLVFAVAVGVAGVGMVAVVGRSGDDHTWRRWSDVGQAFGAVNSVVAALAVAALVVTSVAQSRSQRDQQTEISVRQLHVDLTRLAIDNPHLAAVWPRTTMEDAVTQSQYMYANLLLQHGAYWEKTSNSRQSIYVEGASETRLAEVADEIWREYQAVLACSAANEQAARDEPRA